MSKAEISLGCHVDMPGIFHHLDELKKWRDGENFPPLYVEISPTSCCNQKCFFCYVDYLGRQNYTIPHDTLIRIFKEMGEAGVKACEIQGTGEPLLNPALPEAIVAGKKAGMDICLVTNGTLFTEQSLETIVPCLSFMRFSSMELTPELYARTHGTGEEHYHKALNSIKQAVAIRDRDNLDTVIVVTFVVFDYNVTTIMETASMLKDLGINIFTVKPALLINHNKEHDWQQGIHIKYKDLFEKTKALSDENFKVNYRTDFFEHYQAPEKCERAYRKCYGVEFEVHIDADAKIYPCMYCWRDERYCLGDLSNKSFTEVWYSEERKKALQRFYDDNVLDKCKLKCKQHAINGYLWNMAHPPRHKNVI